MEQPVWYCTSSRSHTTVAKYAEYQAETIKEHYEKSVSFDFETIFLFTYHLPRPGFCVLNFLSFPQIFLSQEKLPNIKKSENCALDLFLNVFCFVIVF